MVFSKLLPIKFEKFKKDFSDDGRHFGKTMNILKLVNSLLAGAA